MEKEAIIKSGPVRCSTVDQGLSILVTAGEDKKLKVWQLEGLKLLSERELPKKPTNIRLTRDAKHILVSDKFGDIFSYPVTPDESSPANPSIPIAGTSKRGSLTSHENPSNGTLILGHTSLLTSFLLTEDEKFVISADRDEHIRVSWYPQGYVIERYCLGHKKFISAINIPRFAPTVLISGGGDPELRLWDWLSGKHLGDIPVLSVVESFIKTKPPSGHHDDGEGGDEKPGRRQGKGKKGKGKDKEKNQTPHAGDANAGESAKEEQGDDTGDIVMEEDSRDPATPLVAEGADASSSAAAQKTSDQTIFVLHRLETVDLNENGRFIVFSAIGASALFYTTFPSDPSSFAASEVFALDLVKPVIDFTVAEDNKIWVLLDSEFQPSEQRADTFGRASSAVSVLIWIGNKLDISDGAENPLLSTINSKCLISATQADLTILDLYAHLASMPKQVDLEHDSMQREDLSEIASTPGDKGKQLTQRELGRLKNKKALLKKIQEKQAKSQTPENITAADDVFLTGRESKKKKSDEPGGSDSVMTEA
ncbi:unnamed protein product [Somion occarium]